MFRFSKVPGLLLAVTAAIAMAACTPKVTRTGQPTPASPSQSGGVSSVDPAKPVVIALLAPSSASNQGAAQLGRALVNAARLSVGDANDPLLQLRVYDTAGDAGTAQRMAQRAIGDGARLIIGPLFGANTKAIRSTAAAANVNVISFSTDSSAAGGPVYLSGFLPEKAAQRILGFARTRGYNALGVFHPDTPYGRVALKGAQRVGGANLVSVTGYERSQQGIPPAAQDFAANARATGAQALLVAESGQALNFVVSELSRQGLTGSRVKYLGLGEWNSRSVFESPELTGAWFPAPDPNAMNGFVNRYKEVYQDIPPPLAVLSYDAVQIAAQLLAESRRTRTEPFSARALTRPSGFRGIVGPVQFGRDGLANRGLAILQIERTRFIVIDNAPSVLGAGS
ncbi:MAG: penicillin-binding protein activator [Pseudomonadota bacterium]